MLYSLAFKFIFIALLRNFTCRPIVYIFFFTCAVVFIFLSHSCAPEDVYIKL